jgi:hypothetical protein
MPTSDPGSLNGCEFAAASPLYYRHRQTMQNPVYNFKRYYGRLSILLQSTHLSMHAGN